MNYYEELGLDPSMSLEEIKKKLLDENRTWSRRVNAPDLKMRQKAETKIQIIGEAQKVFESQDKKDEYDRNLRKAGPRQQNQSQQHQRQPQKQAGGMTWKKANGLASDLIDQKKWLEALKYAKIARDIDPNNPESWNIIGIIEAGLSRTQDSANSYKKAFDLAPNSSVIINNLGFTYIALDRVKDARFMADRAMAIDSTDSRTIALMAEVLMAEGLYDDGIKLLKESLEREPLNENFKIKMAETYEAKAFSYCHYSSQEKAYFIVDEKSIPLVIENLEEANKYYHSKIIDENIAWAKGHYKKEFDSRNKMLFIFPGLILILFQNIFGVAAAALSGYVIYKASLKTSWEKNREHIYGEDHTVKKGSEIVKGMIETTSVKLKDTKEFVESKIEEDKKKKDQALEKDLPINPEDLEGTDNSDGKEEA